MIEPPMAVLSHESWLGFGTPNHQNMSEPIHHSDRTYLVYFFQQKQQPHLFSPLNKILITYPVACFNVPHSSIPTLLEDELGVNHLNVWVPEANHNHICRIFSGCILFMFRIVCNIYTENITPGMFWAGLNKQRSYIQSPTGVVKDTGTNRSPLRMMDLEPLVMRSRRSELKALKKDFNPPKFSNIDSGSKD